MLIFGNLTIFEIYNKFDGIFQEALSPPNTHSNIAHACARRLDYNSKSRCNMRAYKNTNIWRASIP